MNDHGLKLDPFFGAGILGITVPIAAYAIGAFAWFIWYVLIYFLLPFYAASLLDLDVCANIAAITASVMQTLAVVLLTAGLSAFFKMKIYHILLSAAIFSTVFFIIERFVPKIRSANFPETMVIFPALFGKRGINYGSISTSEFVEHKYYLITALCLAAACLLIVLTAWAICQVAERKKRYKNDDIKR